MQRIKLRVDQGDKSCVEEYDIPFDPTTISAFYDMVHIKSSIEPCLRLNKVTLSRLMDGEFATTDRLINIWYGMRCVQDELIPNDYIGVEPIRQANQDQHLVDIKDLTIVGSLASFTQKAFCKRVVCKTDDYDPNVNVADIQKMVDQIKPKWYDVLFHYLIESVKYNLDTKEIIIKTEIKQVQ